MVSRRTFYHFGHAIVPNAIPKYSCVQINRNYNEPYIPYNPESSLGGAISLGSLTHKSYGFKESQSKYHEYMDEKQDPFPLTSLYSRDRPYSYKVGSTRQETHNGYLLYITKQKCLPYPIISYHQRKF